MKLAEHWQQYRPKLLTEVIQRDMLVRDESWILLHNPLNGEHVRINASARIWLDTFDGESTIAEILRDQSADEDTTLQLHQCLSLLAQSDMITMGGDDEHNRLLAQSKRQQALNRQQKRNPLFIRLALINPDNWLSTNQHHWKWVFSPYAVFACICLCFFALVLAIVHAAELKHSVVELTRTPAHWWWYGVLFPLIKLVHEFAHAICIKRWGGATHEAGITLLVFMPIPYIDASDSWAFEKRSQRLLTAAAGIIAESLAVALALVFWSIVEPGLIRDGLFAVIVIGTASTLLFNANPLLRFDGYFILQDMIDIPNLGSRATAYYRYLLKRYFLGVASAQTPVMASGEHRWFIVYGSAALIYRFFITGVIAIFLINKLFFLGLALAAMTLYQLLVKPIIKACLYLHNSSDLASFRGNAIWKSVATILALALCVLFLPLPSSTRTEGIVWVPNQAQVFAGESGVVEAQHAQVGQLVQVGEPIFTLSSPSLLAQYLTIEGQRQSLHIEHRAAYTNDRDKAAQLAIDLKDLEAQQAILKQRRDALIVRAKRVGVLALSATRPLLGQYVKQGELLAFLVDDEELVVRTVINQTDKGKVDAGVIQSTVRLADNFSDPIQSQVIQQIPAANHQLPSPSLAYDGSSGIAVASAEGEALRTAERVFHLELSMPAESQAIGIGGRAYVSLRHQPESLGRRWWRSARQLLLRQLTV